MHGKRCRVTLVLGGARSGKSSYAEKLALEYRGNRIYVATAEAFDEEMKKRIANHRERRKDFFSQTIEEPVNLAQALSSVPSDTAIMLVDCVTVWLGNLLFHRGIQDNYSEITDLLKFLESPGVPVIIVSNEVGQGIVPGDAESRHFRDHAGWLNQALAARADRVIWTVAGIPVTIKE
jgi:adenosylcobinamide kinase/adenosylcobinamide-phosphate guanylyltransferase